MYFICVCRTQHWVTLSENERMNKLKIAAVLLKWQMLTGWWKHSRIISNAFIIAEYLSGKSYNYKLAFCLNETAWADWQEFSQSLVFCCRFFFFYFPAVQFPLLILVLVSDLHNCVTVTSCQFYSMQILCSRCLISHLESMAFQNCCLITCL